MIDVGEGLRVDATNTEPAIGNHSQPLPSYWTVAPTSLCSKCIALPVDQFNLGHPNGWSPHLTTLKTPFAINGHIHNPWYCVDCGAAYISGRITNSVLRRVILDFTTMGARIV